MVLLVFLCSCITVGFLFRFWKYNNTPKYVDQNTLKSNKAFSNFNNLGEILGKSIKSATNTIVLIGGYIVLFSVFLSIIKNSKILNILSFLLYPIFYILNINPKFLSGFICGIIELTNGVSIISNIPESLISINIILCAFLLGFGGFSVVLQVFSIASSAKISIKPYIIGKLLQGLFAAIYTYLFIYNFSIFNLDLFKIF